MFNRRTMLARRLANKKKGFLILAILFFLIILLRGLPGNYHLTMPQTPHTPVGVVQQFYEYERIGDFGSSWELFHSLMKQKFSKQTYIQQRARIFMQDFGVETFEYSLGSSSTIRAWKMSVDSPPIQEAYRISVTETFKTIFGIFRIVQDVYVAQENGQYRILWAY